MCRDFIPHSTGILAVCGLNYRNFPLTQVHPHGQFVAEEPYYTCGLKQHSISEAALFINISFCFI
jgi:hypothetical protein